MPEGKLSFKAGHQLYKGMRKFHYAPAEQPCHVTVTSLLSLVSMYLDVYSTIDKSKFLSQQRSYRKRNVCTTLSSNQQPASTSCPYEQTKMNMKNVQKARRDGR